MIKARPIWCRLLRHCAFFAASFAFARAGSSIAARMAIIAITTKSSMSVKAWRMHRAQLYRFRFIGSLCIEFFGFIVLTVKSVAGIGGEVSSLTIHRPIDEGGHAPFVGN